LQDFFTTKRVARSLCNSTASFLDCQQQRQLRNINRQSHAVTAIVTAGTRFIHHLRMPRIFQFTSTRSGHVHNSSDRFSSVVFGRPLRARVSDVPANEARCSTGTLAPIACHSLTRQSQQVRGGSSGPGRDGAQRTTGKERRRLASHRLRILQVRPASLT